MKPSFPAMYRLTARGGVGLACDEQGITLGPVILVEALAAGGGRVFRPRPAEEIARTLAQAYDDLAPADIARCLASLDVAAKALEARDLAKASVAVLLKLPDLSVAGFAKLAADPSLKKYSPDPERVPAGEPGGGQSTCASRADNSVPMAQGDGATSTDAPRHARRAVHSLTDGRVVRTDWQDPDDRGRGLGWWVHVRSANGVTCIYGHMDPATTPAVGTVVSRGDYVGDYADPTDGHSTGPHVHVQRKDRAGKDTAPVPNRRWTGTVT